MPASKNCIVVNPIYKQEVTCKLLYYKWHIWSGVCVYLHNGKQGETFNDLSWPFFKFAVLV